MPCMDTISILMAVLGAAVGGAAAWFVAKARGDRAAEALRAQLDRAEKARLQATQQWQQARREVEQLRKDMLAHGAGGKPAAAAAPADPAAERQERAAAAEAALQEAGRDGPPSVMPAHGFADTQPMTTPGRL